MDKSILLIEDELSIVEAIRFLLQREGWAVASHSDGADAVEVIRETKPDLLVLDYMLPGRSGLEIASDLRSDNAFDHMPILMLTAKGQAKDREQAEQAGVNRYMTKPFSNVEVVKAVRDLIHVHAR
jgi:DNA-binding response OmpR family regulator